MQIKGSELKDAMKVGQKAICVVGVYTFNKDFYIARHAYGGNALRWEDGSLVDENCKLFRESKWEILVDKE